VRGAKQYTAQQILNLAKAIEGDVLAYSWLKQNHCLELAAVCCGFLNYDTDKSLDWLHKYQFRALWCFIDSFEDNQDAFEYLKFCNQKEWGATYCAALGDNNAIKWLVKNKFNHYVFLSKAIFEHFERYQNRRRHRGGLIWSVLDDSSDGFDGFGGGDFGGGGAGGDW
jgi:uncharacterized membrane protein YgcG